ncbi:MAG: GAF domain-containing sensor histidine kinase [Spirochaetes bacterium]|jgi:signal transduction histidine kinase|nr:GAF domain-containing sensor histidine kinase [Spirochaetota bacterium]
MKKNTDKNLIYYNCDYSAESNKLLLDEIDARERAVLDHINQKVAGGISLDEILNFFFNAIQPIMPCDRLEAAFLEEDGKRLILHYVKTKYRKQHLLNGYASDIMGSPIEKVLHGRMVSIIRDMDEYSSDHPTSDSARLLLNEKILSSITCPIVVEGRPVGLLFCRSRRRAAFNENHVKLLALLSERLGQAMEKAFQIETLNSVIQNYMEMLSFVSHELKSPLSSIITLARTITAGYFGPLSGKHTEMIDRIIKKAEYLYNLSVEYLNLSRFEGGKYHLHPRSIDFVTGIIDPVIELVKPQIEEARMTIDPDFPDDELPITCDPELMRIVMVNLLSNAVKYGKTGGRIRLALKHKGRRIRVSVWNEGTGFPKTEKINLFKKFSVLHAPGLIEKKGHGVGLYVCWKIVQLHGGVIWADSEFNSWAEFTFEIPYHHLPEKADDVADGSITGK